MQNEFLQLFEFGAQLLTFYIPCTIGTIASFFIKKELYKNDVSKKKKLKNMRFYSSFITSILPSVVLTMINASTIFDNSLANYKFGIAILIGVIGEDISGFLLSLKNMVSLFRAIYNGVDGIKQLSDEMTKIDETKQKEDDKK